MPIDRAGSDAIVEELRYLRDLCRRHRDLTMAEVSAPVLRYMLACVNMNEVLAETARLKEESPLRTATDFRNAEVAKDDALRSGSAEQRGAAREWGGTS